MQVQHFMNSYWEPGSTCVTKGAFTVGVFFLTTSACCTCNPMGRGRKVDGMGDFKKQCCWHFFGHTGVLSKVFSTFL